MKGGKRALRGTPRCRWPQRILRGCIPLFARSGRRCVCRWLPSAGLAARADQRRPIPPGSFDTVCAVLRAEAEKARAAGVLPPLPHLLDVAMDVDVEGHLRWLETGAGEPWPPGKP